MKKIIVLSVVGLFIGLTAYTFPEKTQEYLLEDDSMFCVQPFPNGFKMLNGGVYQDSTSAVRFLSVPECAEVTYYWKFGYNGILMSRTSNVLENITVADTGIPVGTSFVEHWISFVSGESLVISPKVYQNVTRLN